MYLAQVQSHGRAAGMLICPGVLADLFDTPIYRSTSATVDIQDQRLPRRNLGTGSLRRIRLRGETQKLKKRSAGRTLDSRPADHPRRPALGDLPVAAISRRQQ